MSRAPRRREPTGQASLEYVAVLALVAAVLGVAGATGALPAVGERVAATLRLGVCVVAGDVCRSREARAAGLAPCTLRAATRGRGGELTLASVRFGGHGQWSAARRSDGTITVTRAQDGNLGVSAGLGFVFTPAQAEAGAEVSLDARASRGAGWVFRDEAAARRFIAELPESARDRERPPDWRTYRAGDEARAAVGAAVGGHTLGGVAAVADLGAGARVDRDGAVTVLLDAGYHGPRAFLPEAGARDAGAGRVFAEYSVDRGGPRELVLRSATTRTGRLVEWSARLDLHQPANRAAAAPLLDAKVPWPPDAVRQVEAVLAQARRTGTVERTVSLVEDRSSHFDAGARLGLALGVDVQHIEVDRRLLSATAWTNGSRARERVDCEKALA